MLTLKHVKATGGEVVLEVRRVDCDLNRVEFTCADGGLDRIEEPGTFFVMNEAGRTVTKHVIKKKRN